MLFICDDNFLLGESIGCIRIATGTDHLDDGTLRVTINGVVEVDGQYWRGETVINECFQSLDTIEFTNPTTNAWSGSVTITDGGKSTLIKCEDCTGSTLLSSGNIVVDGDSDSKQLADSWCLNGKTCSLTWITLGNLSTFSLQLSRKD